MNFKFIKLIVLNFLFSIFSGYGVFAQTDATPPNILLILSDDHSAPFLGCYGNPDLKTPNLDQLANEGMLFKNCFTNAPQCVQSRASIMTGRNVLDIEMLRFSAPLDKNIITFPELLKNAGYYIGLCGRPYHLDGSPQSPESGAVFQKYNLRTFRNRFDFVKEGEDDDTIKQFEEFLLNRGTRPFFMQAGFSDPHRTFTATTFQPNPTNITVPSGMPDTALLRSDLAAHYGEIQRLDANVGKLIDLLRCKGLLDNTLIIFMGDNGSPVLRGKGTLYDLGLHVPFLARYPKTIKAGSVSNILISGEDVGPTILDLALVKPDDKMTGKSFLNAFKGIETEIRDYIFAVRGAHGSSLPGNTSAFDLSRTVFNKNYKLIYNPMFNLPYTPVDFNNASFWNGLKNDFKGGKLPAVYSKTYIFSATRPIFELYNLVSDPNEFNNLVDVPAEDVVEQQMKTLMVEWMILNQDIVPIPIPPN